MGLARGQRFSGTFGAYCPDAHVILSADQDHARIPAWEQGYDHSRSDGTRHRSPMQVPHQPAWPVNPAKNGESRVCMMRTLVGLHHEDQFSILPPREKQPDFST